MADEINPGAPAPAPAPEPVKDSVGEPFTPINLDAEPIPAPAARGQATDSPARAEAAPPQAEPSGESQEAEPAAESPIEPPASWNKTDKERWQALPREAQEIIAQREQERDREIRRTQNEAAERLKGLSAKEQAVERARQQYESALPQILQQFQQQMAGEFADIKGWDDVRRMQIENPDRYQKWDLAGKEMRALQEQNQQIAVRQDQQRTEWWQNFSEAEDRKFLERAPESKDPVKMKELQSQAIDALREVGFSDEEVRRAYREGALFSMRDHRTQLLLRDAAELRLLKARAKAAKPQSSPTPLVPGTAASNRGPTADVRTAAERGDMAAFIQLREKGRVR